MSIFGCIGKGFSIAKSSMPLVLAVFVFGFVWSLINLPFINPDGTSQASTISAVLGLVFIFISIYVQSGSLGYVHTVAKQGSSGFGAFTEAAAKYYLRILGLGLIVGLVMLIFIVLGVLGFVAGGDQTQPSPVGVALAVILAIIATLILLFFFLAPYAVVVDGKGVVAALKSSMDLVKRNFLKVLGVGVILVAVGFGVGFLLGLLMGAVTNAVPGRPGQIVGGLLSSVINAYLGVLTTGAFMALYLSSSDSSSGSSVSSAV